MSNHHMSTRSKRQRAKNSTHVNFTTYRNTSNRTVPLTAPANTLCPKCTGDRRRFARYVLAGNLEGVEEFLKERKGAIPKTWYTTAFDTHGRKLVAFAVHAALEGGMSEDRRMILHIVIDNASEPGHLTTCIKDKRDQCVAHVVAKHAMSGNHVDTVRRMISRKLKNDGKAWSAMISKKNKSGRTAANHASVPVVAERMGGSASTKIMKNLDKLSQNQKNRLIRSLLEMRLH